MEGWKALEIPGGFGVHVPPEATWTLDADGATLVIRLRTEPSTEILISRHNGSGDDRAFLEKQVQTFFERVVPDVQRSRLGSSVRVWAGAGGATVVQGVATDGHGDWWLARAFGFGADYFWMQWTGPKVALEHPVLEIFESFALAREDHRRAK